jgi:hypothetical protein
MQSMSRTDAYAFRSFWPEMTEIAFYCDGPLSDRPRQKRVQIIVAGRRARGPLLPRVCWAARQRALWRDHTEWTSKGAHLAADTDTLIELHFAIHDCDRVHRTNLRAGSVVAVAALHRHRACLRVRHCQARIGRKPDLLMHLHAGRLTRIATDTFLRVGDDKAVHGNSFQTCICRTTVRSTSGR